MTEIEHIKEMLKKEDITVKKLAAKIGMSERGTHIMLKSGDMKLSTLKKIAMVFKVPITCFFETNTENNGDYNINISGGIVKENSAVYGNLSAVIKENELLKKTIEDKEEIIKLLKKG